MALDQQTLDNLAAILWGSTTSPSIGEQLQSIPLSDYVSLPNSVTLDPAWVGTYTTPTPNFLYPYHPPYTPSMAEPLYPWTIAPAEYTYTSPLLETIDNFFSDENLEIIEKVETVSRHTTGERFSRVQLKLPEIATEQLAELVPRIEAEIKLAVIRALRLIPPPQRLRTLILDEGK